MVVITEDFLREEARNLRASGMTVAQVGDALALPSLKRVQQLLRVPKTTPKATKVAAAAAASPSAGKKKPAVKRGAKVVRTATTGRVSAASAKSSAPRRAGRGKGGAPKATLAAKSPAKSKTVTAKRTPKQQRGTTAAAVTARKKSKTTSAAKKATPTTATAGKASRKGGTLVAATPKTKAKATAVVKQKKAKAKKQSSTTIAAPPDAATFASLMPWVFTPPTDAAASTPYLRERLMDTEHFRPLGKCHDMPLAERQPAARGAAPAGVPVYAEGAVALIVRPGMSSADRAIGFFALGRSIPAATRVHLPAPEFRVVDRVACYREAVSLDPDFAPALNNLATVLKDGATTTLPFGRVVNSVDLYIEAIAKAPREVPRAFYNVALHAAELTDDQMARLQRATGRTARWTKKELLLETLRHLPAHNALLQLAKMLDDEGGEGGSNADADAPPPTVTLPDGRVMNSAQLRQAFYDGPYHLSK